MLVFPSALLTEWTDSPILLEKYYPLQALPHVKIQRNKNTQNLYIVSLIN